MKHLRFLLFISSMLICSSCDEESPAIRLGETPVIHSIIFTETTSETNIKPVTFHHTQQYLFDENRIQASSHTQRYHIAGEEYTVAYEARFAYPHEAQAVYTDQDGNVTVYTLDGTGRATQATTRMGTQERTYTFGYTDGFLTMLTEAIDGEESCKLTFGYTQGILTSIHTPQNQYLYEADKDAPNYYQLPACLQMTDIYPLNLHTDALYGHLLGKQSLYLIGRQSTLGNETEQTSYTYTLHAGKPVAIFEDSPTGKRRSIQAAIN